MSAIEDDRKMLLYAAKAAGIKLAQPHDHDDHLRNVTSMAPEGNLLSAPVWNPLIDDGDALRLAVKLKIGIQPCRNWCDTTDGTIVLHENNNGDEYAAARRAIVRAAAEIGGATP